MAAAGRVGAAAKVVDVPDAGVVVQAAIQSRRPYIYPLATIPQLVQNLKVGDKFKSQDDCKAVIGALAIFHNTPFRNFNPNRPTRVGARCICGESCSWGIRFAGVFSLDFFCRKLKQSWYERCFAATAPLHLPPESFIHVQKIR